MWSTHGQLKKIKDKPNFVIGNLKRPSTLFGSNHIGGKENLLVPVATFNILGLLLRNPGTRA